MTTISEALSQRHGADTVLDFFNPQKDIPEERHFTLGEEHKKPRKVAKRWRH